MARKRIDGITVYMSDSQAADFSKNVWLSEFLRYAGVISSMQIGSRERPNIKIYAPKGVDVEVWADMNMKRLYSFGFDSEPHYAL